MSIERNQSGNNVGKNAEGFKCEKAEELIEKQLSWEWNDIRIVFNLIA